MFTGLDESQGNERRVVLRQFDSCIQFDGSKTGLPRELLGRLHEAAADPLALAVWPDGEFPHIQRAPLRFRKDTSDEFSVFDGEEQLFVVRFGRNGCCIEFMYGRGWVDPVALIRERGV